MPAFDVHGDVFVAERGTGDVGLYAVAGNALLAAAALPTAPLRGIQAAAVSPDFRWLAVSERARGALWDLTRNLRLGQVRPFTGAYLEPDDGGLFVDFTRTLTEPRALMRLDGSRNDGRLVADLRGQFGVQKGPWLLLTRTVPRDAARPTGVEYELRDLRRDTPVWAETFADDPPGASIGAAADALVLAWPADLPASRERIRADPRLRAAVKGYELEGDHLLEVRDAATGALRGRMVVETGKGSFAIVDTFALGDRVVVSDSLGRVVVYALATGEPAGYAFGQAPIVHPASGRVAVENGRGRIVLYALPAMRRLRDLAFPEEIVLKAFNADGTRLFVLTADQTAFVLDLDAN
jgi:hypothetical protein